MTMTCAVNHCDEPATHTCRPQPYEIAHLGAFHPRAVTEPPQHITTAATIREQIMQVQQELNAAARKPPPSAAVTRTQADALLASLAPVHESPMATSSLLGIPLLVRELGDPLPEGCMDLRHGRID